MKWMLLLLMGCYITNAFTQDPLWVLQTEDFSINCDEQPNWEKTKWITLDPNKEDRRGAQIKILYSSTGMYFLFRNEDTLITATMQHDFDSLWREDVAEVFLWPDTTKDFYLEYEISPLNKELVLLVGGKTRTKTRWRPWPYTTDNRVLHCTKVVKDSAWYASFYIPFSLMYPLIDGAPAKGTVWRANFYRRDMDRRRRVEWSWKLTNNDFHQLSVFGTLMFK